MKISDVEIIQLADQSKTGGATWASNSILLRLTTSDGTQGYGEAVPTLRVQPVIQSLHEVARVYKGKDPFQLEANLHEWHRQDFYLPVSFESTTALSAFDIACWDIIGKHLGTPIHMLLGGRFRERVRLYINGWYSNCVAPEQFGSAAKKYVGMGYTALKFDPFGPHYDDIDKAGLEKAYRRVKAVREQVGDKVDILIEHHGRFNLASAIAIAERLSEFDPLFVEEPIHPDNLDALKRYRRRVGLRVALGERLLTKEQVLNVLSRDLADYIQVDLTNVGGITQAKKASAIAESFGVEMAFHNAFGPIQNAATIQLDAAIPNFLIQESFFACFPSWKRALVKNQPSITGGYSSVPTRPGLGVEVDESVIEERKASGQESYDPEEPVWVVKGTWSD